MTTVQGYFYAWRDMELFGVINDLLVGVARETEPPPTKVEGFSGLERLWRTVGSIPTEVGGFKPNFWKVKALKLPDPAEFVVMMRAKGSKGVSGT